MCWKKLVPQCFAGVTAPFATHASDREAAVKLLGSLLSEGVTWKEAKSEISSYLSSKNVTKDFEREQIERAKKMLKPWLD